MIRLEVATRTITLSADDQGLANAVATRSTLAEEFIEKMDSMPPYGSPTTEFIDETTLTKMVTRYSEQLIFKPLDEIRHWFAFKGGTHLAPGHNPLYYSMQSQKQASPNVSAIMGIGEGVAGFLAQRIYGCTLLARPNHDFPDMVMESGNQIFMVEAKGSMKDARGLLNPELWRMASFTSACAQMDNRPVTGLLIGTTIVKRDVYNCHIIEVHLA